VCQLSMILAFVVAHIVAWATLGGGWRGAARAPFAVFIPAVALLLLDAVFTDSYSGLLFDLWILVSWQLLYFFGFVTLRLITRPAAPQPQIPNFGE